MNLCLDWLGLGHWDDSYAALKQIEEQIKAGQFGFHQWRWQMRMKHGFGLYYLLTDQAEIALTKADELWALANKADAQKCLCLAQQLRGDALIKLTQLDEAASALEMSIKLADAISYRPVLWEARYQLAGLQPGNGNPLLADAGSLVQKTAQQLTDTSLRQRFLAAPQIQAVLSAGKTTT